VETDFPAGSRDMNRKDGFYWVADQTCAMQVIAEWCGYDGEAPGKWFLAGIDGGFDEATYTSISDRMVPPGVQAVDRAFGHRHKMHFNALIPSPLYGDPDRAWLAQAVTGAPPNEKSLAWADWILGCLVNYNAPE
jgi:hypothetical protein